MGLVPNPPQAGRWGYIAGAFVIILVCLSFIYAFAGAIRETNNIFFALGAVIPAIIALMQIKFIHNWFTDHAVPWLNFLGDHISRRVRQAIIKVWQLREMMLLFTLLGLILGFTTPIPALVHDQVNDALCVQRQLLLSCGDGIQVTSIQANNDSMNIGIIGDQNQIEAPFNHFDAHNNNAESNVEKLIFDENNAVKSNQPYVTLIVATTLSQTVSDPGISSSAGLDNLRGAYIAQHNYNQEQANSHTPANRQLRLKLLIANFGTKDVAAKTVPIVMDQIKLYADSNKFHFIGVVGFPFSNLVTYALNERHRISRPDIPIITEAAEADHFVIDYTNHRTDDTPFDPFYNNFYSIAPPVSDESKVIHAFIMQHFAVPLSQTAIFVDDTDPYSHDLSQSIIDTAGVGHKLPYTVGHPDTLAPSDGVSQFDAALKNIIDYKYRLIFFAGYADDFNILRNKLKANPATQNIPIVGGEGLYYPYSTVYNKSGNNYNYANLFFTTDAAYARTNEQRTPANVNANTDFFPSYSPGNSDCSALPVITPFTMEFCSLFNTANPPSIYGYTLAGFHTILMYDAVKFFLTAWSQNTATDSSYLIAVDKELPGAIFEGLSGHIKYTTAALLFHPASIDQYFKPIDVACTDSEGHTHVIAQYDVSHQTSSDSGSLHQDYFDQTQEDLCKAP